MATDTTPKTPKKAVPVPTAKKLEKLAGIAADVRESVGKYVQTYLSTKELAGIVAEKVVAARMLFYAPQSDKGAAYFAPFGTLVPDLAGRSNEYKEWQRKNVAEIIASLVPDEAEAERIQQNLVRYAVQELLKKKAASDPKIRAHLVTLQMATESQSSRQSSTAAATAAENEERVRSESASAMGLVNESLVSPANEYGAKLENGQPTIPVTVISDAIAAYSAMLLERVTPEVAEKMSGGDRDHLSQMLGRITDALDIVAERIAAADGTAADAAAVAESGVQTGAETPKRQRRKAA